MKIRYVFVITLVLLLAACSFQSSAVEENDGDLQQITINQTDSNGCDDGDNGYEEYIPVVLPQHIPDYMVNLEINPEERFVSGVMTISFQNTSAYALDRVFFNMSLNAFAEGFPYSPFLPAFERNIFNHGPDFGRIDVLHATINLNPAEFDVKHTLLTIYLDEYLASEDVVEIGLAFEARIPRISHRTGGNDYAMWLGNFLPTLPVFSDGHWHIYPYYPVGSPFFTQTSNFLVNITAPYNYTVVSTGHGVRDEGEVSASTSIEAGLVRDFAFAVLSPAYNSRRILTDAGIEISIYYREAFEDDEIVDAILATAQAAFEFFAARIGTYPYLTFVIVESELFMRDSIKYPGMMFVDSQHLRSNAVHGSIVRDVGYQWFYNMVGNNPVTEPWLSHGLVSFLQLSLTMDEDEIHQHMLGIHQQLERVFNRMYYTELSRSLDYFNSWADFRNVQLFRGKLLFYDLWQKMGSDEFDQFVRTYFERYAFSIATAQGMMAVAKEIHPEPLDDFFHDWINSPTLPFIF